jgi:hypothetical protein
MMNEGKVKDLCDRIRQTAYDIHVYHGHGHLEKVYENALGHRLRKMGLNAVQQSPTKIKCPLSPSFFAFSAFFAVNFRSLRWLWSGLWRGPVSPIREKSEIGGRGGIRTPGAFRLAGFQDRCFQPLSHPSVALWRGCAHPFNVA